MRRGDAEEIENLPFDPELKILVAGSYSEEYELPPLNQIDDCFMTNWKAPKIREGWGRFKSYYEIEWFYPGYHFIDTSRSFARMLCNICEGNGATNWPGCDFVSHLVRDLIQADSHVAPQTKANKMMLATLFPLGLSNFMERSYLKRSLPEVVDLSEPRVLNNPRFYEEKNAPMGRLVEIAEEHGRLWALDRAKPLPMPDVLAEEIALLCYALTSPKQFLPRRDDLFKTISEQMEIYHLTPNLWP